MLREVSQWQRTAVLLLIYAGIIAVSFYLAYEIRFDFQVADELERERLRLIGVILLVKLFALYLARQFGTLMTYFSLPDLFRLAWAMGGASLVLLLPRLLVYKPLALPRGVLLIDFLLCFGALCAGRLAARLFRERTSRSARAARGLQPQIQRIAIVGAGDAGASLAKEFIGAPQRGFEPVMFFDDDRTKHGKLVHGVPVVGPPEAIGSINGAATLAKAIIAMPSAPARRVQEVVKLFAQQGLKVETLPSIEELASGRVLTSRIRPVEVQDLLGRQAVELDSAGIRLSLTKRVVMVTGAGGSIGAELCRQIAAVNPARLLLVEQSEAALFLIEQELNEAGLGGVIVPLVADILDRDRMHYIFGRYRPQVIFHAAAHKHVYLMERQPAEAIRNNAVGTRRLAEVAAEYGVEGFVLISTDKAINPTNVMGATKRLAELQLMALAAIAEPVLSDPPAARAQGPDQVHGGPLRQRPRLLRERHPDLQAPDRERRSRHGHAPRGHPLLHDDPRGRRARPAVVRPRPRGRDLRPGYGPAGEDRGPRAADDRAERFPGGGGHRDRLLRAQAGREAVRGTPASFRGLHAHVPPADHAVHQPRGG